MLTFLYIVSPIIALFLFMVIGYYLDSGPKKNKKNACDSYRSR